MTKIKRLVLDVLKPLDPTTIELADKLISLKNISAVNIVLIEMDRKVENVKLVIEGTGIDYKRVERTLTNTGCAIHSIDEVAVGKKLDIQHYVKKD